MDAIDRKIEALERLAARPGTPAEGEAAKAKALQLRAKHNRPKVGLAQVEQSMRELQEQLGKMNTMTFTFQTNTTSASAFAPGGVWIQFGP